jgi:hypothetical protein
MAADQCATKHGEDLQNLLLRVNFGASGDVHFWAVILCINTKLVVYNGREQNLRGYISSQLILVNLLTSC